MLKKIKSNILLLLFCLVLPSQLIAQEIDKDKLKILVKDSNGNHLEKVNVYPGLKETNSRGELVLNSDKKTILLYKENFKPKLLNVNLEKTLEIILEKDSASEKLFIKECPKNKINDKDWFDFLISVPKGFKKSKTQDIDYGYFKIFKKGSPNILEGISGPNADSIIPNDDLINNTNEIKVRTIYDETRDIGFEFTGVTKDGKCWRKLSLLGSNYFYYTVDSLEVKNDFDQILNSSCSNFSRYNRQKI